MDKLAIRRKHQKTIHAMWCVTIFASICVIYGSGSINEYIEYKKNKQDIEYSERVKEAIKKQVGLQ